MIKPLVLVRRRDFPPTTIKLHIFAYKFHIVAYPWMLSGEPDLRPIKEFEWGSIVWKSMILEFHIFGKHL
jgi:hypothetical protein